MAPGGKSTCWQSEFHSPMFMCVVDYCSNSIGEAPPREYSSWWEVHLLLVCIPPQAWGWLTIDATAMERHRPEDIGPKIPSFSCFELISHLFWTYPPERASRGTDLYQMCATQTSGSCGIAYYGPRWEVHLLTVGMALTHVHVCAWLLTQQHWSDMSPEPLLHFRHARSKARH